MKSFVVAGFCLVFSMMSAQSDASSKQKIGFVIDQYLRMHTQYSDSWWLRRVSPTNPMPTISMTENYKSLIQSALERYASVSPLAGSIAKSFPVKHISIFHRGSSVVFAMGEVPQILPGSQEICFIPQAQSKPHPSALYYKSDWGALMISAISYPSKVFAALVFHELGHVKSHKIDKAKGAFAKHGTNDWIEEEVVMHELEADILNAASNGEFYEYIDRLVGGASSYQDAISRVRLKDLQKLDKIIGCVECGFQVSNLMIAQYFMSIGMRHFKQVRVADEHRKRIELYRFVDSF